jgi:hypothetical protein
MPYKRVGRTIMVKKEGVWRVKQKCGNISKAQAALRLLESLKEK